MNKQSRKPPVSFQEKIEWLKHESRFQVKMAELEMQSRKVDRMLNKTREVVKNG